MTRAELARLVATEAAVVKPSFGAIGLREDDTIAELFDSIERVEIVARLEARLSKELPDEELGLVVSFGDLLDLLERHEVTIRNPAAIATQ